MFVGKEQEEPLIFSKNQTWELADKNAIYIYEWRSSIYNIEIRYLL